MKLATRMSLFFLAALAVVLIGLSACIYGLVRTHLFNEVDERLVAGLEIFRGATEFEPNGLEWEPKQRRLYFVEAQSAGPMVWGVFQPDGHQVDGSTDAASLFAEQMRATTDSDSQRTDILWRSQIWRVLRQTLRSEPTMERPGSMKVDDSHDESATRYQVLVLLVGIPLDPALRPLQSLELALISTSLAIWLFAASVGRWLCAKALLPMTRMARTARSISAIDLSQRLPPPGTNDELDDLGHAFNDLLDRLEISFDRQQRFAGEASHQLRTPLTAMLGQLEVALRRDRNSDEYRRALESVQQQAARLRQIVEMLLFLTRENAEAAPLPLENLQLQSWLADHLRSWQQHPRRHDIQFEPDDGAPVWVAAHGGLLAQAVDNLLDNACKYSQPGEPIVIRVARREDEISLVVEDHGCGISPEELPHVFDPFFRCPEARRRGIPGTGLGLAVVRRIVVAMKGSVKVESTFGQGSRFIILLGAAQQKKFTPETVESIA